MKSINKDPLHCGKLLKACTHCHADGLRVSTLISLLHFLQCSWLLIILTLAFNRPHIQQMNKTRNIIIYIAQCYTKRSAFLHTAVDHINFTTPVVQMISKCFLCFCYNVWKEKKLVWQESQIDFDFNIHVLKLYCICVISKHTVCTDKIQFNQKHGGLERPCVRNALLGSHVSASVRSTGGRDRTSPSGFHVNSMLCNSVDGL